MRSPRSGRARIRSSAPTRTARSRSTRAAFTGLPYFPVDEGLYFDDLRLTPYEGDEPSSFQIPTSDGKLRPAHRAGVLRFELEGETRQLTGYRFDGGGEDGSLFVPFLDATSGTETYGAGRYLDLEPEDDGTYILDFNVAYHPSCVYDPRFSCPLTPAENRLPVRIEAGERLADAAHPMDAGDAVEASIQSYLKFHRRREPGRWRCGQHPGQRVSGSSASVGERARCQRVRPGKRHRRGRGWPRTPGR